MNKIVVVGKPNCQACDTMKAWLDSTGQGYLYVNGMQSPVWMKRVIDAGQRTFPQAFVDDVHVGGLDALKEKLS